jgi:hypothetical protein
MSRARTLHARRKREFADRRIEQFGGGQRLVVLIPATGNQDLAVG